MMMDCDTQISFRARHSHRSLLRRRAETQLCLEIAAYCYWEIILKGFLSSVSNLNFYWGKESQYGLITGIAVMATGICGILHHGGHGSRAIKTLKTISAVTAAALGLISICISAYIMIALTSCYARTENPCQLPSMQGSVPVWRNVQMGILGSYTGFILLMLGCTLSIAYDMLNQGKHFFRARDELNPEQIRSMRALSAISDSCFVLPTYEEAIAPVSPLRALTQNVNEAV